MMNDKVSSTINRTSEFINRNRQTTYEAVVCGMAYCRMIEVKQRFS